MKFISILNVVWSLFIFGFFALNCLAFAVFILDMYMYWFQNRLNFRIWLHFRMQYFLFACSASRQWSPPPPRPPTSPGVASLPPPAPPSPAPPPSAPPPPAGWGRRMWWSAVIRTSATRAPFLHCLRIWVRQRCYRSVFFIYCCDQNLCNQGPFPALPQNIGA